MLIARPNNVIVDAELPAGFELTIPQNLVNDEDIQRYYKANGILPATALTEQNIQDIVGCEGIGCWTIGIDFKVS